MYSFLHIYYKKIVFQFIFMGERMQKSSCKTQNQSKNVYSKKPTQVYTEDKKIV